MEQVDYQEVYSNLLDSINAENFEETFNNLDLKIDPYQTKEQYKRDHEITRLLNFYVENYFEKTRNNHNYKRILLKYSLILISVLFLMVFISIILAIYFNYNSIALVIGSFVSIISLPIGILKIIAEYVFPKDEEAHITNIVKATQDNDLKNKKAYISALHNDFNDIE